jgi:hypothetical protein
MVPNTLKNNIVNTCTISEQKKNNVMFEFSTHTHSYSKIILFNLLLFIILFKIGKQHLKLFKKDLNVNFS